MASVRRIVALPVAPERVWDAVRDFGALHERLVPGFVVETRLEGEVRVVTFASGAVQREPLVDRDDARRRLVYTAVESPLGATHYQGTVEVTADAAGGTTLTWTVDVLPHALAGPVGAAMDAGVAAMRRALAADAP